MLNKSLFELRCVTCDRAVGIAEHHQIPVLRRDVLGAHLGHELNPVPFVSATEAGQITAASIVGRREGLMVYKTADPS